MYKLWLFLTGMVEESVSLHDSVSTKLKGMKTEEILSLRESVECFIDTLNREILSRPE